MPKNTLLLVDDEPNILSALERVFSENDYTIFTAQNGLEGLKILAKHSVQVVISDQRMPSMTGLEFFRQVKNLYPDITCIMLSGYADFNVLQKAINEELIYKFLNKPWDEKLLLQTVHDAFQIKHKKENLIKELIQTDYLTKLNNRFSFIETLHFLISQAEKNNDLFALAHLDIDRFSQINDSYGRDSGDYALINTANILKKILLNKKSWLARMGSASFSFLVADLNQASDIDPLLQLLMKTIKQPIILKNKQFYITLSIGVSFYPTQGNTVEQLMKHADLALRYSKKLGGNNYQIYNEKIVEPTQAELQLASDLHEALAKNQFEVFYQPIFTVESKQIVGMEALLRWHHPKQGMLAPNEFIPLCEATGLILPIGYWVLSTACKQIKIWCDLGYINLHVAVNLSARQFNDLQLLEKIKQTIESTKISPENLTLEITESIMMDDIAESTVILRALNKIGILISLDDFGTGYSSLTYLKELPFNMLKIDKSFINDINNSSKNASLTETIILMAKNLNLKVIAEGVEKQAQLDVLKKQQCDFAQGFLFSKAITAHECTLLLQQKLSNH